MPPLFDSILPALVVFVVVAVLTGAVRRWALRNDVLDHPNERSSHSRPTPRGGGVAIVIAMVLWLLWAGFAGDLPWNVVIAVTAGGALVALVGWLDDVRSLSVRLRLLSHFLAAAWAVWWLDGLPMISLGTSSASLGVWGGLVAMVGVVWSINLFNFMDGIDGISAVESISIGGLGGMLLLMQSAPGLAAFSLAVAGGALGFLVWNWAPARIFLGDVGSGFLGFVFATLAIASENSRSVPLLVWAILASVFVVDATWTFARRLRAGFWRDAHRDHAYQRAVQGGWSHSAVSLAVGAANLVLGGIAAASVFGILALPAALTIALLAVGALYLAVGRLQPFQVARQQPSQE